ncbi:unnamed protein product [Rotaria sp. Silwood2]|nr:unnamed protein product [Rotaria sp. Silwood2]
MSSSDDAEVGAYTCMTVILNGAASNRAEIIRELIGLYPISAFLACVLNKNPTPLLTPYFSYAPAYPIQQGFESEECRNHYWWIVFFYIDNLIKPESICLNVSWYLFYDMQFHWIAPLALMPFVLGRKKIAYIIASMHIFIHIGSTLGLLLHYPNLNPNNVRNALQQSASANESTSFSVIYVIRWCRIPAYAIRLLTGFVVINTDSTYYINRNIKKIGSFLATLSFLVCIFSMYGDYISVTDLNRASIIAYEIFSRSAWSLAIGWIIFLCYY